MSKMQNPTELPASERCQANCALHSVSAAELFTTASSHLTATTPTTFIFSAPNTSPAPQDVGQNGELIDRFTHGTDSPKHACRVQQLFHRLRVATAAPKLPSPFESTDPGRIIHHAAAPPGEESHSCRLFPRPL